MKNRCLAALLAALLLWSAAGCTSQDGREDATYTPPKQEQASPSAEPGGEPASADEVDAAYRRVVQQYVNKYGILNEDLRNETNWEKAAEVYRGVVGLAQLDFTGDGVDELLILWAGDGYSEAMDSSAVSAAIYGIVKGEATQLWMDDALVAPAGVTHLNVSKQKGVVCLFAGSTRHFNGHIICWRDDSFVDLMAGPDFSEEEKAWFEQNAWGYGLSGEANAMDQVYLQRIGLESQGEWESLYSIYADGGMGGWLGVAELDQLKQTLADMNVTLPAPSAAETLSQLAYYGDRSKCNMDRQMAEAYAAAVENLPQESPDKFLGAGDTYKPYVFLADVADDGMPILIALWQDDSKENISYMQFWGYDGKAYQVDVPELIQYGGTREFGRMNGQGALHVASFRVPTGGIEQWASHYYTISQGRITATHPIEYYTAVQWSEVYNNSADGESERNWDWSAPPNLNYWLSGTNDEIKATLYANGWVPDDNEEMWHLAMDKNKAVTDKVDAWAEDPYHNAAEMNYVGFQVTKDLYENFDLPTTKKSTAVSLLRQFAQVAGKPSYSFEEISALLSQAQLEQILAVIGDTLRGEIGEVYQISSDLYYIILYENGEVSGGAVVKQTITKGETGFRLVSTGESPAAQEELETAAREDQSVSNITLDYSKAGEDKAAYLEEALTNMDGTSPNDAAKGEIAAYLESAVAEAGATTVKCRNNAVTITDTTIRDSLEQAQDAQENLEQALGGVTLNKQTTMILRVVCSQLKDGEPVQITFAPSMLDAVGDAGQVQVLLGDGQHSVAISVETLTALCEKYGGIVVQLQQTGENTYQIAFFTPAGEPIDQLDESLTFTLPAQGETATVLATYPGGADNWGGQYDPVNKSLEFATPYTGGYEITDNAADITDLDLCDGETAAAIRFMVSKGYFSLDEAGAFDPNGTLDRYTFTEALVRMFFALDRSLKTTFSDVPEDSVYYPYVASGESEAIVEGYEDGTFRGQQEVLREQVIALCSRTLADKKGYRYPEDPNVYLTFDDAASISKWARETTALAVRENLIDGGGSLEPKQAISRGEAALTLYRLFMLLYETPPAVLNVHADNTGSVPWGPIAAGGATAVVLAGAATVILRRKKAALAQKEQEASAANDEKNSVANEGSDSKKTSGSPAAQEQEPSREKSLNSEEATASIEVDEK